MYDGGSPGRDGAAVGHGQAYYEVGMWPLVSNLGQRVLANYTNARLSDNC